MAREPPPRRNDAALLSKIASQEKLRAKLPPLRLCCHTPVHPRAARFFLRESIRWLQESGGFYVKILQKIMARYTPDRKRMAFRSLRLPLCFSFFLCSSTSFVNFLSSFSSLSLSLSLSSLSRIGSELPCTRGSASL